MDGRRREEERRGKEEEVVVGRSSTSSKGGGAGSSRVYVIMPCHIQRTTESDMRFVLFSCYFLLISPTDLLSNRVRVHGKHPEPPQRLHQLSDGTMARHSSRDQGAIREMSFDRRGAILRR